MTEANGTGSPKGEPVYLAIGFLRRPHGVTGEIIMDLHTDFPDRIKAGRKVYLGEKRETATFESVREHGQGLLVRLHGYDTPEAVGRFRNHWVYVQSSEVPPLPKGKYYKYELVGLRVIEENGNPLGELTEILETGANDVYIVRREDGKEILLPAIPPVVLHVDMTSRVMTVHLIDGLVDDA